MNSIMKRGCFITWCSLAAALLSNVPTRAQSAPTPAQSAPTATPPTAAPVSAPANSDSAKPGDNFPLGPGDQVSIWALGAEELSDHPARIDSSGYLNLPLVGPIRASGLTARQLKSELETALRPEVRKPLVVVNVTEFASRPVSVLGAVNKPGVYQLQGRKTLSEVLSMAQGPRTDAGGVIHVKRRLEYGPLPLPNAHDDATGQFSVGDVSLRAVLQGQAGSLYLAPEDVVAIPTSPLVYVIGDVRKPGGFVMGDRANVSILQALSMAEGFGRYASTRKARLLRANGSSTRTQIPVDLASIIAGKKPDVMMRPDDILVVPNNNTKTALAKVGEVAAGAVTGVAIYRVGLGF